jgi:hypothetical protein
MVTKNKFFKETLLDGLLLELKCTLCLLNKKKINFYQENKFFQTGNLSFLVIRNSFGWASLGAKMYFMSA